MPIYIYIYIRRENDQGFTILIVYVDDCIVVSNKVALIQQIKDIMQQEFDMSDEGKIHYNIGNAIIKNRQEGWLNLHQQNYLTSKLQEFSMLNCKHLSTPMQLGVSLSKEDCPDTEET